MFGHGLGCVIAITVDNCVRNLFVPGDYRPITIIGTDFEPPIPIFVETSKDRRLKCPDF